MGDSDPAGQQRGFRIRGRVQGVGFRWWTRRGASELGLRGTVANCQGGMVEVHVAGDADRLSAFAGELEGGPPMARVDGVEGFLSTRSLPRDFEIV
jgi:acylphosphatase